MKTDALFPNKYLKASDLGDAQPIVTINRVTVEEVGQNKDRRPIAYFEGKQKGLCVNKTNARAIDSLAGDNDTDAWPGVQIQLYVAMVVFQGQQTEAIRVRAPKRTKPAQKPQPVAVDDEQDTQVEGVPF